MRILMTGGGTGGHVNPALAIANTIKENDKSAEIAFVGTPHGIENKLVPKAGYKLYNVDIMGIKRSLSLKNIKAVFLAVTSPLKAKKIIKEFKPDAVIGTGGYVSWPVCKAAVDMGVLTLLHESNAVAGMTVRMLAGKVDRVYLNFDAAKDNLPEGAKTLRVGCPLNGKFAKIEKAKARKELGIADDVCYILSYGGSMGAEKVNDAVFTLMEKYVGGNSKIFHTHATGTIEKDIAAGWFCDRGLDKYDNIEIKEYIYDMPVRMAAADIVICRSGAMTVSELSLMGKCAVFIPSPNVTDDQQYKNASVPAKAGGAVVIRETPETGDKLCEIVKELCENPEKRRAMEEKIKSFAAPDANKIIYGDLVKLIKSR